MQRRTYAIIVLLEIIGAAIVLYIGSLPNDPVSPNGDGNFDNEGRYDSTNLNYMGGYTLTKLISLVGMADIARAQIVHGE